jgi:hypothetical protein
MGDILGAEDGFGPEQIAQQDLAVSEPEGGVPTDVEDVMANGEREGKPVFDVEHGEFYQNMEFGRRRLRFKSGSNIQQYMQRTRYNKPFFIRYKDEDGKEYIRRVK